MSWPVLATREDFFIFGIEASRLKVEYLSLENPAIERWIQSASDKVYAALSNCCKFPLQSWGDDIREIVCILAAYSAKAVIGLDAAVVEATGLESRYSKAIEDMLRWGYRNLPPESVQDASYAEDAEEGTASGAVPIVVGYARTAIGDSFL